MFLLDSNTVWLVVFFPFFICNYLKINVIFYLQDLFNQSQDGWRKRLEREAEKRKKLEELYRQALEELRLVNDSRPHFHGIHPHHYQQQLSSDSAGKRIVLVGGPDYQEGPHSTIGEDEFYDAVEAGLDKIDEEQQYMERLKNKQVVRFASQAPAHPLWPEVSNSPTIEILILNNTFIFF